MVEIHTYLLNANLDTEALVVRTTLPSTDLTNYLSFREILCSYFNLLI